MNIEEGSEKADLSIVYAHCDFCNDGLAGTREQAQSYAAMHAIRHKTSYTNTDSYRTLDLEALKKILREVKTVRKTNRN